MAVATLLEPKQELFLYQNTCLPRELMKATATSLYNEVFQHSFLVDVNKFTENRIRIHQKKSQTESFAF